MTVNELSKMGITQEDISVITRLVLLGAKIESKEPDSIFEKTKVFITVPKEVHIEGTEDEEPLDILSEEEDFLKTIKEELLKIYVKPILEEGISEEEAMKDLSETIIFYGKVRDDIWTNKELDEVYQELKREQEALSGFKEV